MDARERRSALRGVEKKAVIGFLVTLGTMLVVGVGVGALMDDSVSVIQLSLGLTQLLFWPLAFTMALALPLLQVGRDSSVHTSFLQGGCYSEVLATRLSSREVIDGIAFHSARAAVGSTWRGVLFSGLVGSLAFPGQLDWIWALTLLWFPTTWLSCLGLSYLNQQAGIWRAQLRKDLGAFVTDLVLVVLGLVPLLFAGSAIELMVDNGIEGGLLLVLPLLALGAVGLSRYLAIVGLERFPRMQGQARQAGRRLLGTARNPWVKSWSDNAVVVRETHKEAARTPGGLLGWLFFRQWFLLGALLVSTPLLLLEDSDAAMACYGLFLFGFGASQWVLSGLRTRSAVIGEIENRTFAMLENTCLTTQEFVKGWLIFGSVRGVLQSLILLVPLSLFALKGGVSVSVAFFLGLGFLCLPVFGAAAGLYASVAPTRRDVNTRFGMTMMMWPWLYGFCLMMLMQLIMVPGI
ncbi:MAG: hypothetical protein KC910_23825, partial [Candidatus Eremiobacteraeota bacterium]|nr:hypothetical protein [Candidatus Eremiobacteraeota bacterium]